jgi:hypothetical protein
MGLDFSGVRAPIVPSKVDQRIDFKGLMMLVRARRRRVSPRGASQYIPPAGEQTLHG